MIIFFIKRFFIIIIDILKIPFIIITIILNMAFPSFFGDKPYSEAKYKNILLEKYLVETNILMNDVPITIKYDDEINSGYILEIEKEKELKTKYIPISYNFKWYNKEEMPLNIHTIGEKEYIINKLIFDHSKGNYFEKIEKYLDENKERILKNITPNSWETKRDIIFELVILKRINKENPKLYYGANGARKIVNNTISFTSIEEDLQINKKTKKDIRISRHLKEKDFFAKPTKYHDIDWSKYIEYMEDYPVLVMKIRGGEEDKYRDYRVDDELGIEEINKIYKEIEKWYNPNTFQFVIWSNNN